ncbi:hypothetical protein SCALIN_C05_0022 [Candidatus Scalindua japonica]|uniref:Uncharacterized protein n=1 Tax=Candidatus Scalindua japonica TaxID=1284222 RepID=A0A286TVK7_9BACT|nr:hypothetical protein [Candidatus Scalindua japonica]GAX59937.1 hypothetical protein SCALIN_C05_0022 [Candidatus Scalindua japonica]
MRKPVYCFIDDSPFELNLFKDVIEVRFRGIQFIYASTYDECHRQLKELELYPSLFILDLYGPENLQNSGCIPRKELLEERIKKIPGVGVAYDGLEKFDHDKKLHANEYLKRLFSILNEWRNLFSEQCASLDQGCQFGINNLLRVRQDYPSVTAIMYTRKGVFTDAVKLSQHNCDGIYIKPPGATDEDIFVETEKQAESLMDNWNKSVMNSYCLFLQTLNTHDKTPKKLADMLSRDKYQISKNKEEMNNVSTLLDSLQTTLSNTTDTSTPKIEALIQWVNFYYSLP